MLNYYLKVTVLLLIGFINISCDKKDDPVNTGDPTNLWVEVVSIDQEAGEAEILATANNAVLYELYIDLETTPEASNNSGAFTYAYEDKTVFTAHVRAYGSSGRYVKSSKKVVVDEGGSTGPVPIDRGYTTPLEYSGYALVWQDEFDGNSINSSNWSFDTGNGTWGWGNNELEYYRTQNAWVGDGVLTIEARKESFQGYDYTSAKLKTKGKRSFQYGRIDIRALMPQGQGMWPALWTLGNNIDNVSWPNCGEIDMMEMIGGSDREKIVHGTAHWDSGGHASHGKSKTIPADEYNLAEAYHVFTIIWDENSIKWFMDDQQYNELTITDPTMSEFHQNHWIIMNVAVGGNWPGSPDATTVFPQQMKVDYIRVFQANK